MDDDLVDEFEEEQQTKMYGSDEIKNGSQVGARRRCTPRARVVGSGICHRDLPCATRRVQRAWSRPSALRCVTVPACVTVPVKNVMEGFQNSYRYRHICRYRWR